MSIRTERVGAKVRDALGAYILRAKPDYLEGLVTVTSVKMSPDLSVAKVYVSLYGGSTDPDVQVKRLNAHTADLRHAMAPVLDMKRVPEFRFYRDDTLDAIDHITELLKGVRPAGNSESAEEGESDAADHAAADDDRNPAE